MRRSQDEAERQTADDLLVAADPGHQGLSDRQGLRRRRSTPSRCSAATATSASMASSSSSAMRASPRSTKAPTASRRWTWSAASCRKDGGRAVRAFFELVGRDIADAKAAGDPAGVAAALEPALGRPPGRDHVAGAERHGRPRQCRRRRLRLYGADGSGVARLDVAQDGAASSAALDAGGEDEAFHEAKLITARFYAQRELPHRPPCARKIEAGAETLMKMPAEAF